jgi:hypothetical protein
MSDNTWPNANSPSTSSWQTSVQTTNPQSQFGRKIGLLVGQGSSALDLSNLEIDFKTTQGDFNSPSTALIRVFNPAPNTVAKIQNEFVYVTLQAGYVNGNFGVIFNGQILQTKTGKLSNVDRYIDLMCIDGALYHCYAFVNSSVAPNGSNSDQLAATVKTLNNNGIQVDPNTKQVISNPPEQTGGIFPRGKVLYGLASLYNDDLADKVNSTWFVENGVLKIVPLNGYLPGEAVIINSATGQVGVPQVTEQGIMVRCLLNPKIKLAMQVQLNNTEISTALAKQINGVPAAGYPNYTSVPLLASLNPSGLYRVIVKEHSGQTRGNSWYTDLICLNIDPTNKQVQING